jgi:hypothetical protein
MSNIDRETVEGFGDEWTRFDQSEPSDVERESVFEMRPRGHSLPGRCPVLVRRWFQG